MRMPRHGPEVLKYQAYVTSEKKREGPTSDLESCPKAF